MVGRAVLVAAAAVRWESCKREKLDLVGMYVCGAGDMQRGESVKLQEVRMYGGRVDEGTLAGSAQMFASSVLE